MKFTLLALFATAATLAQAQATDKIYLPTQNQTCYKVMVGEHDAELDCKPGHLDDAPTLKDIPPQARGSSSEIEEREAALDKRGSCALGLWACKLSCKNMGCGGGRCRTGRWGVCSCSC